MVHTGTGRGKGVVCNLLSNDSENTVYVCRDDDKGNFLLKVTLFEGLEVDGNFILSA